MMRLAKKEAIRYALVWGMLVAGLALMALKVMLPPDGRRNDGNNSSFTATHSGVSSVFFWRTSPWSG